MGEWGVREIGRRKPSVGQSDPSRCSWQHLLCEMLRIWLWNKSTVLVPGGPIPRWELSVGILELDRTLTWMVLDLGAVSIHCDDEADRGVRGGAPRQLNGRRSSENPTRRGEYQDSSGVPPYRPPPARSSCPAASRRGRHRHPDAAGRKFRLRYRPSESSSLTALLPATFTYSRFSRSKPNSISVIEAIRSVTLHSVPDRGPRSTAGADPLEVVRQLPSMTGRMKPVGG